MKHLSTTTAEDNSEFEVEMEETKPRLSSIAIILNETIELGEQCNRNAETHSASPTREVDSVV